MFPVTYNMRPWLKKALIGLFVLVLAAGIGIWYIFTEKFTDTTKRESAYTVNATDLIHEFQKDEKAANKKYAERILTVNGIVSETEEADSIVNIKFTDEETGGYIIFAFQEQNVAEAKQLKEGDTASIKGSCSGGAYSEILEAEFIAFKRCALNK